MRTNSHPEVRGAWYYDKGDFVYYRGDGRWDFAEDNLIWVVDYASPVRQDGERQAVTIRANSRKFGEYVMSASNIDLIPIGAQQ